MNTNKIIIDEKVISITDCFGTASIKPTKKQAEKLIADIELQFGINQPRKTKKPIKFIFNAVKNGHNQQGEK